jgi:hypothetical protein
MATCGVSKCLGHAVQETIEEICDRCSGMRWVPDPLIPLTRDGRQAGPPIPLTLPFTCARCRAVLSGRNAADPLDTPTRAQQAARAAAGARLQAIGSGKDGGLSRHPAITTLPGAQSAFYDSGTRAGRGLQVTE